FRRNHREYPAPKEEELTSEQRLRSMPNPFYNRQGEDLEKIVNRTVQDLLTTVVCWEEEEQDMLSRPQMKEAVTNPVANSIDVAVKVDDQTSQENQLVLMIDSVVPESSQD